LTDLNLEIESEVFYRAVFENSRDAIGLSLAGTHVFVNPAYLKMFGYQDHKELVGKSILDLIAASEHARIMTYMKIRDKNENPPGFYETRGRRKDGTEFDMEVTASSYFRDEKIFTLVILRDISAQKKAAQSLIDSENRFRTLAEASPVGIFYQDLEGNCLYVNHQWQEITGLSWEQGIGLNWLESIHPEDQIGIWDEWESQIQASGKFHHELRFVQPNGSIRWVNVQTTSISDTEQKVLGYVGTLEDITSRKSFEVQIQRSLHEREVLLQEIHHRVKNNFQVMLSMLNLQMRKLQAPEAHEVLQTSHNRIRSMSLVHELLYDSRSITQIEVRKYFKELTRELTSLYMAEMPVKIEFDLNPIHLSFEQAMPCGLLLTEILTNSFKYGFPNNYTGQAKIFITLKQANDNLLLQIEDNGTGSKDSIESKQGLGLRLIKSLISQLNGHHTLEQSPGIIWKIWFPNQS
jgi:PAS domain S-box-containing protein